MRVRELKTIVALLAVGLLAVFVGCGGSDDEDSGGAATDSGAETTAAEFESVNLGAVTDMSAAPLFVASEKGFFPENGLDVKLKVFASGADMNKALQAGDIQFATASTTSVPSSRAAGLMTSLISGGMNDATSATDAGPLGIVGRADAGAKAGDAESLRGKKVGVLSGSTSEAYLRLYLEDNGMKLSDVKAVNLPVPDHPVSLKQGDVDAVASWEPYVSQSVRQLGDQAVEVSRGDPVLGYVIGAGATDETIESAPETLRRFVAAIAQASQFIRENPEEASEIVANFIDGLDPQDATTAIRDHVSFDPRLSKCTDKAVETATKGLVDAGQIKEAPPIGEMVNHTIIDQVEAENPDWFSDLPPLPAECE